MTTATAAPARLGGAYWRLWTASTISNLGDGMLLVAMPLLAARLTRNPTSVALVTVCQWTPWLVFSLVGGAIADRVDSRLLMVRADVVRAVVVAALAIAIGTDSTELWMLYATALVLGMFETAFEAASSGLMRSVVPTGLLTRANSWIFGASDLSNDVLGKPIGAALFATVAWLPFGVDAVSFALAGVLIASIRRPAPRLPAEQSWRALPSEIALGVRWVFGQRSLRVLVLLGGVANLASSSGLAVMVLFSQDELGMSERGFGLLLAATALGSMVGAVSTSRMVARIGVHGATAAGAATQAAWCAVIALADSPWVVAAVSVLTGYFGAVWGVAVYSYRQHTSPPELVGRAISTFRWGIFTCAALGALLGGLIADRFGLRAPFVFGAVLMTVALAASWRRLHVPELMEFRS